MSAARTSARPWRTLGVLALCAACGGGEEPVSNTSEAADARLDLPPLTADLSELPAELVATVKAARAAVRAAPDEARPWIRLGTLFEANGPLALAPPCYLEALELAPERARTWYRLAMAYAAMAHSDASADALERALELDPSYAPAHWRLGWARIEQGRLDAAGARLREALALDPDDPAPWVLLARVHLQRDEADEAARALERALALDPGNLYARGLLGSAYRLQGRTALAEQQTALGAGASPQFVDAWNRELEALRVTTSQQRLVEARRYFAAGEPRRAIPILEALLEETPDDTGLLNDLGTCLAAIERYPDARRAFERSLELEPGQRNTLLNLGLLLEKTGAIDEALATIDAALERNPSFAGLHRAKGDVLLRRGDLAGAVDAYRRALEYDQRGGEIRMSLGLAELELRRWSDARGTFEALVDGGPAPPDAWVALAHARLMLDDLDAAEEALARAEVGRVVDERRLRRVRDGLRDRRRAQETGGAR